MPGNPIELAYLDEVEEELSAIEKLLAPPPSRFAPYHLQQAAEKLTKALRLNRGLNATTEHRISRLLDDLDNTDPWKSRLLGLDRHSQFATAYRYPGGSGSIKKGPTEDEIRASCDELRALLEQARRGWP